MATRYWNGTGGADNDLSDDNNWSGAVADTDVMVFDGRSADYKDPTEGGGFAFSHVDGMILVKESWNGNIGKAGSPFHTGALTIIVLGSGEFFFEIGNPAENAETCNHITVANKNATVWVSGNNNDGATACEVLQFNIVAGTVHIGHNGSANADVAVQYLNIMPLDNDNANVTATMYIDCERTVATTYKPTLLMTGGTLEVDTGFDEIRMYDGTLNFGTDLGDNPETGLSISTLRLYGGTFNWRPDSTSSPWIGVGYLYGGTVDASSTTNADRAKILGNTPNRVWLYEGAVLNIANGMGNIALDEEIYMLGGVLITDKMTDWALTYNIDPS